MPEVANTRRIRDRLLGVSWLRVWFGLAAAALVTLTRSAEALRPALGRVHRHQGNEPRDVEGHRRAVEALGEMSWVALTVGDRDGVGSLIATCLLFVY